MLQQVGEKSEIVSVDGELYHVHLSWHRVAGIDGYVAGLKFSDQSGSMDSSKSRNVNMYRLGGVIARKALQMLESELQKISILGFYLLTDDLEVRQPGAAAIKQKQYQAKAIVIHTRLKHRLPFLTSFEVQGGLGWAMSEKDFVSYEQFKVLETELAKQIRISPC